MYEKGTRRRENKKATGRHLILKSERRAKKKNKKGKTHRSSKNVPIQYRV
jgi:hypothetical protein